MYTPRLLGLFCASALLVEVCADDAWPGSGGGDDSASWSTRVDVPLWFDAGGRYVVGVAMSTGSARQNFSFTLSTGTGLTSVAGTGGNLDEAVHLYNESASPSAQLVTASADTNMFGQSTDVTVIKETCAINGTGGDLWEYWNQTIFVIKNLEQNVVAQAIRAQLGSEVSGIVGLGTNRVSQSKTTDGSTPVYQPNFADSIIGQWFNDYQNASNFTFALSLNLPVILPTVTSSDGNSSDGVSPSVAGTWAGVMHLLQPDPTAYVAGSVKWVNANVSANATSNSTLPPSDWTVILDGWTFANANDELASRGQIVADIDPIYTGIYVPQDQAILMHAAIPGAALQTDLSTLGNLSEAWTIPCDSMFTFGIVLGGQTFVLEHSTLVIHKDSTNTTCVSGIEAWTNIFETQYLFGSRFMSTVYTIFTVPRDGAQSIGIGQKAPSSSSPSSSLNVKAIIGGSVGGAALLALTALGVFYLRMMYKRDRELHDTPVIEENKTSMPGFHIEPFTMGSPTSTEGFYTPTHVMAQSPTSSHHVLTPMAPPRAHAMAVEDRYSLNVAPPSYYPQPPDRGPSSPGEKASYSPRAAAIPAA